MDYKDIRDMEFDSQGSMLEFVLDLFHQKMCDPTNQDYLPKLVPQLKDPNLDPYSASADWPLSDLSGSSIMTSADQICLQATPSKYSPAVGIASTTPAIVLSNVFVNGLVNVLPEKPIVTDPNSDAPKVSVALDFCRIKGSTGIPDNVTITGDFTLNQACCVPARGSSECAPADPKYTTAGDGAFTCTLSLGNDVDKIQMVNNAVITVQPSGDFLVEIKTVSAVIPTAALSTTVIINTKDHKSTFEQLAEEALNSEAGKQQLIDAFVQQLTSQSTLTEISKMITTQINNVLSLK